MSLIWSIVAVVVVVAVVALAKRRGSALDADGRFLGWPVVSQRHANDIPYPYVFVESDGTARELHLDERQFLQQPFLGGDGARPYTKPRFDARDGWGSLSGFCLRKRIPSSLSIGAAPRDNPNGPMSVPEYKAFLLAKGLKINELPDGAFQIVPPNRSRNAP